MKKAAVKSALQKRSFTPRPRLAVVFRWAARCLLPFVLLSFVIASSALADTTTVILATGMSGAGFTGSISPGSLDSNWQLSGTASGSAYVLGASGGTNWGGNWWAQPGSSYWMGPGTAQWIGASNYNSSLPAAPYTFTSTFNLSNYNLSTVTIKMYWTIDDGGTLSINGTQIASLVSNTNGSGAPDGGSYGALNAFSISYGSSSVTTIKTWTGSDYFNTTSTIPANLLLQGVNTLTIQMTQADQNNEGTVLYATASGSPVPVPAAILLFGPGLACLVCMRKRLMKRG